MGCAGKMVLVLGERWPAKAISYLEPVGRWDSGFMVVLEDAPEPGVLTDEDRSVPWCFDCVLGEHPELGRGLDLAREHGDVGFDIEAGEWFVPREK